MLFSLLVSFFLAMVQTELNARFLLVRTMPKEKLESFSVAHRIGSDGCCDQLTLSSEGVALHVDNKELLGTYVKDGYVNGRVSYKKTEKLQRGYVYLFMSPKSTRGTKDWMVSDGEDKGTNRGGLHFFENKCRNECPRSCRGGRVVVNGEWKIDTTLRIKCACENLESWCLEVKPSCDQELTKRKCRKYCGLCQEPCEDKEDWCKAAQPNCNTQIAKENCKEYCGFCTSKNSTTLLP